MSAPIPDALPAERAAPIFAALGDELRLSLVNRLAARGPQSIVRLSEGAGVTRQAVTKHLRVLAEAGIARSVKSGRETVWSVDPATLTNARHSLEAIERQWDEILGQLKAFVEGKPVG